MQGMVNEPYLQKVSESSNLDRLKSSWFHEYTEHLMYFMLLIFATIFEANSSTGDDIRENLLTRHKFTNLLKSTSRGENFLTF